MNSLINLTPQQLRQAADLQERIAALQGELSELLGGAESSALSAPARAGGPKRRISAAGLERIRAAQRARWARARAGQGAKGGVKKTTKGKGRMSPAARARIAEKMKAIWAARKAGK